MVQKKARPGAIKREVWSHLVSIHSGVYTCVATWDEIRMKDEGQPWWKLNWFSDAIPKHGFIGWLAVNENETSAAGTYRI